MRWIPRNRIGRNLRLEAGVLLPILLAQSMYAELMVTPQDLADRSGGTLQAKIQSPDVSVYYIMGDANYIEAGFVHGELESMVFNLYSVDRIGYFEELFSVLTAGMERRADVDPLQALDFGIVFDGSVVYYERTDKSGFVIVERLREPDVGCSLVFQTTTMQNALIQYYSDLISQSPMRMKTVDFRDLLLNAFYLNSEESLKLLFWAISAIDAKTCAKEATGQQLIDEIYRLFRAFAFWTVECSKDGGFYGKWPRVPIVQNRIRVVYSDSIDFEGSDSASHGEKIVEFEILDFRPNLAVALDCFLFADEELLLLFESFLHLDKKIENREGSIVPGETKGRANSRLEFLSTTISLQDTMMGDLYLESFPLVDHIVFDKYFRNACVDFKIGFQWYRVHFAKSWWGGWGPKEYRHLGVE